MSDEASKFSSASSWEDKFLYLIQLGNNLEPYPEEALTEAHRIRGCQSRTWVKTSLEGKALRIYAKSESTLVSGLAAILISLLRNKSPQEVVQWDSSKLVSLGLVDNLTPSRSNGLYAMLQQIKADAAIYARLEIKE